MEIVIRLLASYRRYLPDPQSAMSGYYCQVAPGTHVADVLAEMPLPDGEVCTFLLNGRHAEREKILVDGDILSVFPAAGGG
jgi:sulfur carrier protein ThiS